MSASLTSKTLGYREMIQRRADLVNEADQLVATAKTEGAFPLVDAAADRYTAIKDEVSGLTQAIAAEEEHRDMLLSVAGPYEPQRISGIHDRIEDDPKRGFAHIADFAHAVRASGAQGGSLDDRLRYLAAPSGYMQESGDSSGNGYLVPAEFSTAIMDLVADADQDLFALIGVKPTSSNAVEFLVDETTVWGTNGVKAKWRSEATQMTATNFETAMRQVRLWELYVFVLATSEMEQDVASLNDRLTNDAARAFRWKIGEAIINGSGVGRPMGIMNAAGLVSQAKESAQTATTIVAANIARMWSRLIHGPNEFWLAHPDTFSQFPLMTIGDQPIWLPPSGFTTAPGGNLFGRPVYFSDHCQTLGTAGDLILINPDGYAAYRRTNAPDFAVSMHLFFDYAVDAYRWMFRFGGQPLLSAAISPANGSSTRSHFVDLATRS